MYIHKLNSDGANTIQIVWLHGWRLDGNSLKGLAGLLEGSADNYLIDLPGFGKSPLPETPWSTSDYADEIAKVIQTLPPKKTVVVGHSFGGAVTVQLASRHPDLIKGAVLLAAAGIPKKRSILFKTYAYLVRHYGKILKKLFPFLKKISLSSSDYKASSGILREILIKSLDENLTDVAQKIAVPTLIIYGENDMEKPAYCGKIYHKAIENSLLYILPNETHLSVLSKPQTAGFINAFVMENLGC